MRIIIPITIPVVIYLLSKSQISKLLNDTTKLSGYWCGGAKANAKQLFVGFAGGVPSLLLLGRIANTAYPKLSCRPYLDDKTPFASVSTYSSCRHPESWRITLANYPPAPMELPAHTFKGKGLGATANNQSHTLTATSRPNYFSEDC